MGPPTVSFGTLWHVGYLDPAAKGSSYEGEGLSVSTEPESWRQIARLGNAPTWSIDTSALRLVDVCGLRERDVEAIWARAEHLGLVRRAPGWRVSWHDSETDEEVNTILLDRDEAVEEAGAVDGWVEKAVTRVGTEALRRAIGARHLRPGDVADRDHVLVAHFDRGHPEVDGLWWDERHAPASLSAPRGVIFPRSMGSCRAKVG